MSGKVDIPDVVPYRNLHVSAPLWSQLKVPPPPLLKLYKCRVLRWGFYAHRMGGGRI